MRGDQLLVYRNFWNMEGIYQHHGIDCGDGSVIHYRKPSEIVERTSLATFSLGNVVTAKEYTQEFCYIPEVVVARAESRLGEAEYSLLFNNCEHFATWCKTGISYSKQVRGFAPTMNKFNTSKLSELIKRSLKQADRPDTDKLVKQALADIKTVWEQVQPEYQQTLKDLSAWEEVAKKALGQNRNDLAKAALVKKRDAQRKAWDLESQLNDLATMTENLVRN